MCFPFIRERGSGWTDDGEVIADGNETNMTGSELCLDSGIVRMDCHVVAESPKWMSLLYTLLGQDDFGQPTVFAIYQQQRRATVTPFKQGA